MRKWLLFIGLFTSIVSIAQPTITQISPTSASSGSTIVINGTNLTGVTAISLGGTAVTSFQVLSSTTVTAVVGSGATGAVSLTTAGGTTSFSGFTFVPTLPAINSMSLVICSGVSFDIAPINGINGVVPAGTTYSWNDPSLTGGIAGAESKSVQTSIYGTLTNSTNVTQTAVYSVTPFKSGAGSGQPFTVTITILASANISPIGLITCSGVSFSITPINIINGQVPLNTLYTWDVPTITAAQITGGLSAVNSMNINGTLFNNTPLAQTATYTVTPNTSGCIGKNFTVTLSLLPTATIQNFTRLTTSGNAFTVSPMNIINGTIPTGTLYSWNAPTYTGLVTGGQTGMDSPNITGTLNNGTGSIQTATYLVYPRSGNCIGTVFSVVVTVQSSVSSPTITSFVPTSAGAGASITITGTNFTGVSAITLGGTAVSSFQVLSSTTILAVVGSGSTGALSIATSGGFASLAGFTYLNNTLSVTSMTAVICSGSAFQLSPIDGVNGIIPQGTTYSWGSPQVTSNITGGQTQTGKAFIYGTLVNTSFTIQTATYTVVPYEASSGLGAAFTVTITVLPAAQIAAFSRVVCSGVGFTITPVNLINGTIPSGTLYSWGAPITSTPSFTGNVSGSNQVSIFGILQNKTNTLQSATYSVIPNTFPGNCVGAPFPVTIYVNPTADISSITLGICTGLTFSITPDNNVNGIIPSGTTYRWSLPNYNVAVSGGQANSAMNNITGNLSNTSNTIQQAIYQVIPTTPICGDGATFSVVVNLSPRPIITGISTSTCSGVGFMVTPTNGIHGTVPDGTLYSWSLPTSTGTITGSESRTDNPSIITGLLLNRTNTIQTVTYIVTPRFGDCVGNVFTLVVTLYPTAEINAMSTVTCSGTSFSVTVTDQIHGIVPNGTQYSWSFPTFSGTVTGGVYSNNNPNGINGLLSNRTNQLQTGTYAVTPNSGSCLGIPFTFTIWLNPTPEIVSFTNATCSGVGFSITPTNGIQGIIPVATLYTWAMPQLSSASLTGGQTGFNTTNIVGTLINNSNTTQTATYSIIPSTPNCGSSYPFTLVVSVHPKPQINPLSTIVCSGATFTITPTNFTNGIVPPSTLYSWGTPTFTASVVGGQSGNNQSFISGTLTNLSNLGQEAYYTITPRLGNCVGSAFMLTVYLNPTPVISSMSTVTCSGVQFRITPTNNVNGIIPNGTTFRWNIPTYTATITGGESAAGQSNVFGWLLNRQNTTQAVTYIVTPSIANCGDGAPFSVTVSLPPTAEISTITTVTCSGITFSVTPSNNTHGIVPEASRYSWNAPTFTGTVTGGASATNNPGMVFGTLSNRTNTVQTVTYRVTPLSGNCVGATFSLIVTLNPMPEILAMTRVTCNGVQFSVTPTNGTNGIVPPSTLYSWGTPTFTASVVGGQSGNNQSFISGTLTNLSNLGQEAYYTVTPRLGNCVGSAFMLTIYLNPTPVISSMSAVTCSGVLFSITPTNNVNGIIPIGTTYRWNIPTYTASITGGASATGQANVFGWLRNTVNTTQTASYIVTPSTANCGDGASFMVTVTVPPTAEIVLMNTVTCSGVPFTVSPMNNASGIVPDGSTFSWNAPTFTGTVTGGASATNNPDMVFGTLSNRTNTIQTVTYRVVPVSGFCTGATFSLIVTLQPTPEIVSIAQTTSSGTPFAISPANVLQGIIPFNTLYSWNLPTYSSASVTGAVSASNQVNIFGTLTNATNSIQTATYSISPFAGNCSGTNFIVSISLLPTIIAPTITSFTPSSAGAGATITITGTNLNTTTAITLGGLSVASFQVLSSTTISAVVGAGASGDVSVTTAGGTAALSGFTYIYPTPTIVSFAPFSGPVGTLVTITGTNLNKPTAISIGGVAAIPISFSGSTLVAMVMPGATSGSVSVSTSGGTANGTGNFTIIPSLAPYTQQGGKLVGTGAVGNAFQGNSVAVSADGNTAIIGGFLDDGARGAAWIFTRSGNNWTQQGNKLGGTGAYQGMSVALSADGNTAIIGGDGDDGGIGAAWVYTRNGSTWTQQGEKLVGTGAVGNAYQGKSVALSADGNTAIIGGSADDGGNGAAWLFTRSGSTWSQQGNKLVGSGSVGKALQGYSVAMSADGNTAIIGGYMDNVSKGAAWIFTRNGNIWSQQGSKLTGTGLTQYSQQGWSVALNADGNTAIVGGNIDDGASGAAWIFTRSGSSWTQQGNKLVGTGAVGGAAQGNSVAVSADGNTVIIGGYLDNGAIGAAWVFTRNGSSWTQKGNKLVGTGSVGEVRQGASVAVSADGNTAIIGGNYDNGNAGAAWIFTPAPQPTITSFSPTAAARGDIITINGTNLTGTSAITLGGTIVSSFTIVSSTDINAVVGNGATGSLSLVTPGGIASLEGFNYINQIPEINSISITTCSGINFSISPVNGINGFIPTNTTYNWDLPSYSATITGGQSRFGQTSINGTLINQTTEVQTATYIVTPFSINGEGNPFTVTITILPSAVINTITSVTCSGIAVWVTPTNEINGIVPINTIYSWESPSYSSASVSGGISGTSQTNITGSLLINQTNSTQTATYIVVPQTGTCVGATFSFVVTINPTPKINIQTIVSCSGVLMQLTPLPGGNGILPSNTLFSWDVPVLSSISVTGGVSRSSQTKFSYQLTNSTNTIQSATYTIIPHTTNGCTGNAFTITVNLQLKPLIAPISTAICSGLTFIVNPTDGVNGIVPVGTQYRWSMPSTTGTITGGQSISAMSSVYGLLYNNTNSTQTVTYQVTPSTSFCGNGTSFSVVVSLYTSPVIATMYSVINSGIPFEVTPTDVTNGIIPNNTRYSWTLPSYTGSISGGQSAVNQLSITGLLFNQSTSVQTATYSITPITTQGCFGIPFSLSVTVHPNLSAPTITSFSPSSARTNETITITGTNLNTTTAITLGGTSVASFQVLSSTSITAIVGNGATGAISITTADGTSMQPGFTFIPPAPTINSFEPNSGPVGTLVTINGTNLNNPTAISIGGVAAIPISFSGNTVVAMVMPGATSGGISVATLGGTSNASGNFTLTSAKVPNSQQGAKLVGSGSTGTSNQGRSVSVSADGNTAIIGGNNDNGGAGAAWIYTRSGETWNQQGNKLVGSGATGNALQGSSVALSADGNTALIGASGDNTYIGAAWVFTRTNGIWTQQGGKLVGTGAIGSSRQGGNVALSADGNTAVVGGGYDNGFTGATWIWTRNGETWTQMGSKLVGTGAVSSAFQGASVAVSADGKTVIVGGSSDNTNTGAVWVWTRSGESWIQQGNKLVGDGATGKANQGSSVALSADGNTALVGGYADNTNIGAAWIWTRSGGTWTQQGSKLVSNNTSTNTFQGNSVALSADGNIAIIGGYGDNTAIGASWLWKRSGVTWGQQGDKLVGTNAEGFPRQGYNVALSSDGTTAVVGGYFDNSNIGASWIFAPAPQPTITNFSPTIATSGSLINISGTNFTGTSAISFGGTSVASFSVVSSTSITAIVGSGSSGALSLVTPGGTATLEGFSFFALTPTINSFEPNSGPAGTLVTITGTNLNYPTALNIGGVAAIPISFNGNTLVAMVMPGATSGGVSITTVGGTANASGNFNLTTSKIPNSQQGPKLIGTGAINNANQGWDVAVSADGNTAIMGGNTDNSGAGAAWVYTRNGNTWTQQGNKLVGSGATGKAQQGYSVAISADGNTAIIGGTADNSNVGAAWVWTRSGGTWTQQGNKLVGTGAIGSSRQGGNVALSADGNTAVVSGFSDNSFAGAVWVWKRNGETWTQQGSKLVGSGAVGPSNQGTGLAVSADGNTLIVGGYNDNSGAGTAWIWTRNGDTWTQQGSKLTGTGATGNAGQGGSVAISAEGNTAIIGGYTDNSNIGAVWVWTRSGATWTQQGSKLVGTNNAGSSRQGFSLALSADGNTAIIGGYGDNSGFGASWIWSRSGETWSQQGNKLVGTNAVGSPRQGYNVALSSNGTTALVGGYFDNSSVGATWIFTAAPLPTITNFSPTVATAGTLINITGTNFTGTSAITLGGTTVASFTVVSSTSIIAIVGSGTSGALSLVTPGGTATLGGFSFIAPPPTITNFTPTSAGAGSMITIIGTNLTGTSAITLGGTSVASFTVVSSTTITAIVGNGGTGALSLVTPGGSATLEGFTYINQIPSINPINLTICSGVNFSISPVNGINGFIPTNTTYSWMPPIYTATTTGGQSKSGQTFISGTLINQTNEVQTATYIVTPYSLNGEGNPFTITINILPSAVINTITSVTCSGIAVWVTPTNEINGIIPINTLYSWASPSYSSASVSGGISGINRTNLNGIVFNNLTNTTQSVIYTIVPITGNCVGTAFSYIAFISPVPIFNTILINACTGKYYDFPFLNGFNGVIPSNTLYSWDTPILSSQSVSGGMSKTNQSIFSFQLTNSSNTVQSATYTLFPKTTDGCAGNAFSVTVFPQLPPKILPISISVCSGISFTITPKDGIDGIVTTNTNYTWSIPSFTGSVTGGDKSQEGIGFLNINGLLFNNTNRAQTVTYQVKAKIPACITSNAFTIVVTLNPIPVISSMSSVINSGIPFSVTPTDVTNGIIPNNTSYSWSLPNYTASISGGQSAINQLSITGLLLHQSASSQTATYSITPISTQGCIGMPFSLAITVQPNLTAPIISSFTPSSAGTGATITITGTNLNNTSAISLGGISVASFQVLSSTTISAVVGSGATGALSLINPNGTATLPGFVYISNAPSINSLSTATCSGASFTLSPVNGINGNIPDGTTYSWSAPTLAAGLSGGVSLSNQIFISGTLFNTTSSVQTAVYTIVPSHPTFGIGAPFTVTIKVNPELVITPLSISGCGKMIFKTIPLTNTNGPVLDSSLHVWTTPNQTVSFITRVRPENNFYSVDSVNWINEFNFTKRFYYTPNPSGSCFGANYKLDVYLNPIPSINAITLTNCGGLPFVLSPTNGINGIVPDSISFSWNVPILSGSLTGGNSGANLTSINGQLFNPSTVTQTATYLITPISTNGNCVGAAFTLTVSVNPSPAISPINITTSSGIPFAISPANGLQGIVPLNTRYSWNLPTYSSASVTGAQSAINQANIFGTLTNATNSIQTATYTINAIAGNCTGANFIVSVSLLPTIIAPTITSFSPSSAGTGATITITGTNLNNTSAISLGGISVASFQVLSSTTIMAVVGSGATGSLSLTAAGGSAALSGFVFLSALPAVNSLTTVICSGTNFTLTPVNGINGSIPSGTTYSWSVPQLSAGLTGALSGINQTAISGTLFNATNTTQTAIYIVTPNHPSSGNGAPFNITVTVHPTAKINSLTTVICGGVTFTITPTHGISGIIPQGTLYSWMLPQTSTPSLTGGQTGFNRTNITGFIINNTNTTQTVTYVVTPITTLCGVSNSFSVIVTVYPSAQISPLSVTVCSGNTFTLTPTNFTNGIVPVATRYTWSVPIYSGSLFGGNSKTDVTAITGTLLNSSSVTQTATYFVSPRSGSCVGPVFTVTASINPTPEVSAFSITGCRRVTFTAAPINGNIPSNTLYSWAAPTFSASMVGGLSGSDRPYLVDTLANVSNLPQEAYYSLTPKAGNCVGANFTLTVYISPEAVINAISIVTCSGVPFVVSPTNGADGIVPLGIRYKWDIPSFTGTISGGEPNNGPSNIFGTLRNTTDTTQTATYIVTPFVVTCGLGDPFTVSITLLPAAEINSMSIVTCSGVPFVVTPTNGTNGIVPDGILYSWSVPIFTGTVTGGVSATNSPTILMGKLLNRTNMVQTATYVVTPRVGNCVGVAFSVIVSLQPTPEIISFVQSSNSGAAFAITPSNGLQGIVPINTLYSWSIPTITSASVTGAQNGNNQSAIFGTLNNPSNAIQTATYLISPLASNCIGASFTVTVSVKPTFQITAFAPTSAGTGATVTIRGKGFANINQISFGGSIASSFTILSDTAATAIVGAGASGFVKVNSPLSVDSLSGFTFGLPVIRLYRADSTLVFGAEKGKYSRALNYSVSANFLQNPLQIAAPDNFQVSRFQDSAYSSSLSINHQNGTIDSTKIFVRFKLDTLGSFTGSLVHTSLAATTRSITVTGSSQCDSVVYITPIVNNILADTIICFKDSLVLSTTSGTFNNYLWSTGDTTKNLVVKSSGSYSLQVGSGKGCLSNVSRIIKTNKNTNPIPSLALIGNKTLISSIAPKYRWLVNNTLIPGNNSNSLVPSKVGFYAVETTNDSICWDRSTDYPIFVLSNPLVNDTLAIKVYPNPTSTGTFFVVATLQRSTNVVARATVADGNGNVLLQTNKFIFFGREVKIPITLAVKGTVFVRIDINGDVKTQTVILQ